MVTRVSKFAGGLGIDATSKLELQANATVTLGNGTSTGNVVVGGTMSIAGEKVATETAASADATALAIALG
jgi:hypothetical protein